MNSFEQCRVSSRSEVPIEVRFLRRYSFFSSPFSSFFFSSPFCSSFPLSSLLSLIFPPPFLGVQA